MPTTTSPYHVSGPDATHPLRQCELLTTVMVGRQRFDSLSTTDPVLEIEIYDYAIVLSQDCDLDQDHSVRFPSPQNPDKLIPCVLMAMVNTADDLFARVAEGSKRRWDRLNVERNSNPRYQFLQSVSPNSDRLQQTLPEFVIDFKRYFTVPTDELYHRITTGETLRRCVLVSPYLEHLAQRFASYLSRVGLPSDHESA